MRVCLMLVAMSICGFASAGQLAPVQKSEAAQKSAMQKDVAQKSSVQKGEGDTTVRVGFFGRLRAARSCRSGSC
jgi:hypothetical protein